MRYRSAHNDAAESAPPAWRAAIYLDLMQTGGSTSAHPGKTTRCPQRNDLMVLPDGASAFLSGGSVCSDLTRI